MQVGKNKPVREIIVTHLLRVAIQVQVKAVIAAATIITIGVTKPQNFLIDNKENFAKYCSDKNKVNFAGKDFWAVNISVGTPTYWFTNLEHNKRHEEIILHKKYNPDDYPKYDNYDAIEVSRVADIPFDYKGVMGVPITFLDKFNPDQFEILGATQRGCHDEVPDTKKYDDYWEVRQNGEKTGSSGGKTNENANLVGNDGKKNYFINKEGRIIQSAYQRIFIKNKRI